MAQPRLGRNPGLGLVLEPGIDERPPAVPAPGRPGWGRGGRSPPTLPVAGGRDGVGRPGWGRVPGVGRTVGVGRVAKPLPGRVVTFGRVTPAKPPNPGTAAGDGRVVGRGRTPALGSDGRARLGRPLTPRLGRWKVVGRCVAWGRGRVAVATGRDCGPGRVGRVTCGAGRVGRVACGVGRVPCGVGRGCGRVGIVGRGCGRLDTVGLA